MKQMPIRKMEGIDLDENLIRDYMDYLTIRVDFLLDRFRRFPNFEGVQTGYNSITGEEFSEDDISSYSWINGRGACVFARFADHFPKYHDDLISFALHSITAMERHWRINNHHFPFMANPDGTEKDSGCVSPQGYKSYSDLYACFGFLEYGVRAGDHNRIEMAKQIFDETLHALDARHFTTEPDPTPEDRILENPWSVALDIANEFVKQLNERKYLDIGAKLITYLLDNYYIEGIGAYVEYITPESDPFVDEYGRYIVDPGHAIEFCSFCLEFSRLAERYQTHSKIRERVNGLSPKLILLNIEKGWNKKHPGIYKTIDATTGSPINETMPWWILPETLLATVLAYERTRDSVFLERFKDVHNAYFEYYMNPKTSFGPYQNISGKTGKPIDIVPACKFQDPEFHSGKNILTVTEVIRRISD